MLSGVVLLIATYLLGYLKARPTQKKFRPYLVEYYDVKWRVYAFENGEACVERIPYCKKDNVQYKISPLRRVGGKDLFCPFCGDQRNSIPYGNWCECVKNIETAKIRGDLKSDYKKL